jgi:hypothetical protein
VKQRYVVLAALLAVAAALTACNDDTKKDSGSEGYTIGPGDQYVALGDSYTAAPKVGEPAADDGCLQTLMNYPHRVADATGVDLVDNSCTGANTSHLTQAKPNTDRGPQLDAIDADTDLVTMRLGATDYQLFIRIVRCALTQGPSKPGTPCQDADARFGDNSVDNLLPEVQANLDRAVDDIEERAPDARIILLGYPQIAPAEGTCDLLPLPAGDYAYPRRILGGINDALEAVADEHDLTYIDLEGPSEGHDICSDDPWMAGAVAPESGGAAWHPYAVESEAEADLVLKALAK